MERYSFTLMYLIQWSLFKFHGTGGRISRSAREYGCEFEILPPGIGNCIYNCDRIAQ